MFKVMAEQCAECLYGKDKIVSNSRRAQILRELSQKDNHFVCHKATMVGQDVCCRADFDKRAGGQLGRIAERLQCVQFVTEAELKRKKARA